MSHARRCVQGEPGLPDKRLRVVCKGEGTNPQSPWSKRAVARLAFCEESGSKKGFTELLPYKNVVIWSPAGNLIWRKRSNK